VASEIYTNDDAHAGRAGAEPDEGAGSDEGAGNAALGVVAEDVA